MKKVIAGGFLTLSGTIGVVASYMMASTTLVTHWNYNRYLTSIFQKGGFGVLFVISLAMLVVGLILMLIGCIDQKE